MFIDIHGHTTRHPLPIFTAELRAILHWGDRAPATPEQLLVQHDRIGVERAVLMAGVNPECQSRAQSVEEVMEIAKAFPDRFIPFCNVDPRALTNSADAPLGDVLRYYRDQGCRGIGEVCANLPFLHPMVQNLFRHAEDVRLPLTFHMSPQIGGFYGLYDEPGLPQLERCLQLFPKLKFLGHSQPFWAEIARLQTPASRYGYPKGPVTEEGSVPILMRRYPNLYGDLSARSGHNALARDKAYAAQFLNEFQDRLLFGTDICQAGEPTPLVDLLLETRSSGAIGEEVFDKIARGNALKLLSLQ